MVWPPAVGINGAYPLAARPAVPIEARLATVGKIPAGGRAHATCRPLPLPLARAVAPRPAVAGNVAGVTAAVSGDCALQEAVRIACVICGARLARRLLIISWAVLAFCALPLRGGIARTVAPIGNVAADVNGMAGAVGGVCALQNAPRVQLILGHACAAIS